MVVVCDKQISSIQPSVLNLLLQAGILARHAGVVHLKDISCMHFQLESSHVIRVDSL